MNEFGPKTTLEELECFAKNHEVSISLRPPKYNSPMWVAKLKHVGKVGILEYLGYGDRAWIAIDDAAKRWKRK